MSKFYRVECGCGNVLIVYSNAGKTITCSKCGTVVAKPTGGHVNLVSGRVVEASN